MSAEPSSRIPRTALVAAIALLLIEAAKLVAFHQAGPMPRAFDAAFYWQLGTQVAAGDVWMTTDAVAHRTPGYPWFLGLMQAVCGTRAWWAIVAVQYAAVWGTTALTGWWAYRLTGRPWLGVAAIAVCVASAARAGFASTLLTESLFTLELTATGYLLCRSETFTCRRSILALAVIWTLMSLLRPVAIALGPAWLIAWWRNHPSAAAKRWSAGLLTVLVLAVGLGPWIVRNVVVWHRPTLTVCLGRELWVTTLGPGQPEPPDLPATPEAHELVRRVSPDGTFTAWRNNWAVSHALTASGLSDVEADDLMGRVARQAMAVNPLRAGQRAVWRAIDFWRATYLRAMADNDDAAGLADEQQTWGVPACQQFRRGWLDRASESRLLVVELTSLLALVGLVGLWLSPATLRFAALSTALIAGVALLTVAVEFPAYRYRMVLEPVLIVVCLSGWTVLFDVLRRGRRALWEGR
jgi:hypothetical protein